MKGYNERKAINTTQQENKTIAVYSQYIDIYICNNNKSLILFTESIQMRSLRYLAIHQMTICQLAELGCSQWVVSVALDLL